jgi:hypothetical protein
MSDTIEPDADAVRAAALAICREGAELTGLRSPCSEPCPWCLAEART